ncbi:DUF309 domain-containing protein [Herbidospora sp. RD11066]
MTRDRDDAGRARNARPRDAYGRPLPHGAEGVPRVPDDYAPTAEQALTDGVEMLHLDRPFHAHEIFEGRWKCCPAPERELWQGLAQICVGLTHLQRGNAKGAETLLERGAGRLSAVEGRPYGIDAASAARAQSINDLLEALKATSHGT